MRTSLPFVVLSSIASIATAYEVTAWSGAVCSGIDVGHIEDPANPPVLTVPEATPNAQCITIDTALPANCDVYLCVDANCDDQGVTVEGPRDARTRVQNQSFEAMQVGCQ